MVEYSVVRWDCPSICFFFARLCSLLEVVGRQCLKVGLFVGRNCPFRSSELETGLSSSEDRRALKVTSLSTHYKA